MVIEPAPVPTAVGVVALKSNPLAVDAHRQARLPFFLATVRASRAEGFLIAGLSGPNSHSEFGENV
jgi:hypothetical protein